MSSQVPFFEDHNGLWVLDADEWYILQMTQQVLHAKGILPFQWVNDSMTKKNLLVFAQYLFSWM